MNEANNRNVQYESLMTKLKSILLKDDHIISNMAIISAEIMQTFNFHWVGFYICDDRESLLYLGPYQGPLPCTRIAYGKGVCGSCWENQQTLIVSNVHEFPGHIACSDKSNSEIVVPLIHQDKVVAVLDIDSDKYDDFSSLDQDYLEKILALLR